MPSSLNKNNPNSPVNNKSKAIPADESIELMNIDDLTRNIIKLTININTPITSKCFQVFIDVFIRS